MTDRTERPLAPSEIAVPVLYVALSCARPELGGARHSLGNVDRAVIGRSSDAAPRRTFASGLWTLSVAVQDSHASSRHALFERLGDDFFVEDLGSRNGTRVNGAKLTERCLLADGDFIEVGHTILQYRAAALVPMGFAADAACAQDDADSALQTLDAALAQQAEELTRVAQSPAPILLLGETGTGKELLARAIHRLSGRSGRFVAVNCGALPVSLVEAQLFGHVRGAFSGAITNAPGLLRAADHGTLLLDEVGDLPEPSQIALLRVLQEQEVLPVGGVEPVKIDLRVIAATHKPLRELAAEGKFRDDLLARLRGYSFALPPLRARRQDIGLIIGAFSRERPFRLLPTAGRALLRYDWPHNVRELRHALGIAATLAGTEPVGLEHLPAAVAQSLLLPRSPVDSANTEERTKKRLVASLTRHRGNVTEVARELGKARMQVQRWLKRYNLDWRAFK